MSARLNTVNFIYTYLPVSNLQNSLDLYVNNFGFENFGETELRITPTVLLTLIENSDTNKVQDGKSRPIIGFCVSDVHQLHSRLNDAGIAVSEIVRHNWGSVFEFIEPDENKIEVWSGYSEKWSENRSSAN